MAEPKYLRSISVWPDEVIETIRGAEVHHIPDLLQRALLPLPSRASRRLTSGSYRPTASPGWKRRWASRRFAGRLIVVRFLNKTLATSALIISISFGDALAFAADRYGWIKRSFMAAAKRSGRTIFRRNGGGRTNRKRTRVEISSRVYSFKWRRSRDYPWCSSILRARK